MIEKIIIFHFILFCIVFLFSCSQFALVASGGGLVLSQNALTKTYNTLDLITIMQTEKNIKAHVQKKIKKESD
jgi:predicted RND superfamily exporter protein|tara:strand:+ start:487 stop:705 length:219 start_codon:yes stop_codon:yes gene_type:complete